MRGMHSAILYCHQHAVCHRDIKLENFVFERAGDQVGVKLIDFGLSAVVHKGSEQMAEQVGTVAFMAPEMLSKVHPKYNTACDMWALGVAMYELRQESRELRVEAGAFREAEVPAVLPRHAEPEGPCPPAPPPKV